MLHQAQRANVRGPSQCSPHCRPNRVSERVLILSVCIGKNANRTRRQDRVCQTCSIANGVRKSARRRNATTRCRCHSLLPASVGGLSHAKSGREMHGDLISLLLCSDLFDRGREACWMKVPGIMYAGGPNSRLDGGRARHVV